MVRKHRILDVMFDKSANWKAHICDAKVRALKKLNSWGSDQKRLLKIHQMTILPTIQYGEAAAYGSATKAILKQLDPVHHKGVSLSFGTFAIYRVQNLLCEAGLSSLPEMREREREIYGKDFHSNQLGTSDQAPIHEPNIRPLRHKTKHAETNIYKGNKIPRTMESIQEKFNSPQPS
jgi:hypothetical protein